MREKMQAQIGVSAKRVILPVAHAGAIPEVDDVETTRWLKGLSMESRLLRWVACSDFLDLHKQFIDENRSWPENSTFAYWWQTLEDRVLRCVEDVVFASTSSFIVVFWRLHGPQRQSTGVYHSGFSEPLGPAPDGDHWVHRAFRCEGTFLFHATLAKTTVYYPLNTRASTA